ncbi:MAG TPA: JAB domain-containing protein [Rubricoccaceae bacterium]
MQDSALRTRRGRYHTDLHLDSCLLCNARLVVISHNHPSGNPEPSREDVAVTNQLVDAGKLMGAPSTTISSSRATARARASPSAG